MPVLIYRLGLAGCERLLGAHWMLITTVGRKSGRPRQTIVDVMHYDQNSDAYYVAAAYGPRADWYRNLQVAPICHAQVGRRKFAACAAALPADRAEAAAAEFYRRLPGYARVVMGIAGQTVRDEAEFRRMARGWALLEIRTIG